MAGQTNVDAVRMELRNDLARILYCDVADVTDDATFTELGLDSILGFELLTVVNARYSLQENIDSIYGNPTVPVLSDHLVKRIEAKAAGS